MSFSELQATVSRMSQQERHRLTAYLVSLDDQEDQHYRNKLAQKIDDQNAAHWATVEDLDKRLGLD